MEKLLAWLGGACLLVQPPKAPPAEGSWEEQDQWLTGMMLPHHGPNGNQSRSQPEAWQVLCLACRTSIHPTTLVIPPALSPQGAIDKLCLPKSEAGFYSALWPFFLPGPERVPDYQPGSVSIGK